MKEVIIYTDGACSGNPGPGGWAAILRYGNAEKELSGYQADTTNNRMEMMGAIEGLRALTESCKVSLHTDSAYLSNAINKGWLKNWQRNGFIKADKKPVENVDLWQALQQQLDRHQVFFVKVKGHADDTYNNRCDILAKEAIKQNRGKG
ncbi:ribonuclease HI [Eubacteriales bacterium OttesenSCG-928-M02]|nr:ribonuclease HI [Eubacteriales bacterium OttesenSCG-928-M02]